jgi:Ycf66 protein N-terminus
MLAYFLSVLVGTGSVGMYFTAFLFPEIHRKYDFVWSGIGLFYALVLWVEADQLGGGLLVAQTASVLLLGWFGWQTIDLRRQLINPEKPELPWIEIRQEFSAPESSSDQSVGSASDQEPLRMLE